MNSQVKGASPFLINLAIGFLEKQRQAREADPEFKGHQQYFIQLYTKILLSKGDYDKVIEFLHKNESSFGIVLDKKKLIFKTLLKKGDNQGAINELISMIKINFENVNGDFQSMYDHHEILISLLADAAKAQNL